jgi:hypothetical protein
MSRESYSDEASGQRRGYGIRRGFEVHEQVHSLLPHTLKVIRGEVVLRWVGLEYLAVGSVGLSLYVTAYSTHA